MKRQATLFLVAMMIVTMVANVMPAQVQSVIAAGGGSGSVSLTTLGTAYTQDFDTLANTGTTNILAIDGWYMDEAGTSASNNGQYQAGTGSNNAGDTYSFGASASTERAFGGLLSGTLTPTIGAQFTNNTGTTITALGVSYTGEMWRAGVLNRGAADRLDFQLSTDATSLTTGTWVDYDNLDFQSPNISTTAGALDGNSAGNRTSLSFTLSSLSIPTGSTFWIRWMDFNISSSDDGLSVDDFSITPDVTIVTTPSLSINDVSLSEGNSGTTSFDFTVNLSAPAAAGGVTFDVATADNTATIADNDYVANALTGQTIPAGSSTYAFSVLVNGDTNVEPNETFFVNVTNVVGATVVDGQGQGTILDEDVDVCTLAYTPIYTIQGSGLSAAITGNVTTQGVVVGDFEGSAAASGFYMQDLTGDGNPGTSDGIFVFTGSNNFVSVGQVVRVTGFARERFNQTTLNGSNSNSAIVPAANIVPCGTGSVPATDVTLPFANLTFPEQYEGMLVRFPQSLVIAEYFNYDRFGEMVLALPLSGESRPFTGTAIDPPGAPANARSAANALSRITLDDAQSSSNPSILRHPNSFQFLLDNLFRGGDLVTNAVGVLGYDFSLYRIVPTGPAEYTATNLRPAAPEPVGGSLRVAAMNTLNYFLTADYPNTTPANPLDNKCGPLNNMECRGWDSDQPTELTRQRDKLLAALAGLDADIIGLNELENSGVIDPQIPVEPLADIVAGLPGYLYINTGTIGTDAIKVGLIYRPAKVAPIGMYKILDSTVDPRFIDTKSRPALAQTFQDLATGGRFTVVVNHLKSKGSACDDIGDFDAGDGQGNCNGTRTLAAQALVDWLATDPTGSGDPDFLIMGDLNSYAMEDPITAVKAGSDDTAGTGDDYTNLIHHFQGTYAYSYTFDGQAGYLDHALANTSLFSQVTGAADWHINSDEPDVLDYDTTFKPNAQDALYEPNAYRSSDHDPVVVGLNLVNYPPELGDITVTPNPVAVSMTANASVDFTDPDALDTHTATWDWGDGSTTAGTVTEANGAGTITGDHAYAAPGFYTVSVTVEDGYSNSDTAVYQYVIVYNPRFGSTTGGGWFTSPAGAYLPDPAISGKAEFSFDAKYVKSMPTPVGNTSFYFNLAGLSLTGSSYDWLVVSGNNAWFYGSGMLNGAPGYTFRVSVVDTGKSGEPDTFRIQIWDANGDMIYDNEPAILWIDPPTSPIAQGNITVRK